MLFEDYIRAELVTAEKLAEIERRAEDGGQPGIEPPKTVRVTVDLRWAEHRAVRLLCLWYAEQLDVPQVAGAELFRVLLQELLTDERLATRVGAALAETGGNRRRPADRD